MAVRTFWRVSTYRHLYSDADGQWFVNYLECVLWGEDEIGPDYSSLDAHRQRIVERLLEFRGEPRIWSKYAWTARYHNYFCAQYPEYFGDEHRIDGHEYEPRRSRIAGDQP